MLDAIFKKLGVVPNLFRVFALSPATLEGLLGLSGALSKTLDVKTRERIAIAVANVNGCDYCLSAHTYIGLNLAKITPEDAEQSRKGSSTDPKAAAAVRFAVKVAQNRGKVTDADVAAVKLAGYSEAQIVDIVGVVAENVLTNFLNNVAQTDIDFPVVHIVRMRLERVESRRSQSTLPVLPCPRAEGEYRVLSDFLDLASTPSVKAAQQAKRQRRISGPTSRAIAQSDRFGEAEMQFVADRDSFYMATVSESGWPYVQHRGGPRGFLRVRR